MGIVVTSSPNEDDDDFVVEKTREYNQQFVDNTFQLLSVYFRNSQNEIIGGLTGKTFWNWLHVEYLWVHESERTNGIGTKLMLTAETEAVSRGCLGSTLDTFSFQALDFYKGLGYSVLGRLNGYSGEYQRHYLQKRLGQSFNK